MFSKILIILIPIGVILFIVLYLLHEDDEFIHRTNEAYERCVDDDDDEYYSVDDFLEEMDKW